MTEANALFDLTNLLSYQNVMVIIACWSLVVVARKAAPKFFDGTIGKGLLPIMPVMFGEGLVWATMSYQPDASVGERILLGIVLGTIAANGHTVLKRFGLHGLIPGLREGDRGMGEADEPVVR